MTDTKTRILNTALRLFNRLGERNVTTNHIAEALAISPGNLYYHYRNKAAIVAALFERYQARLLALLAVPEGPGPLRWDDKMRYFEGILESMWEGRFLHRDLAHFLHQDPALRESYKRFMEDSLARGLLIYRKLRDSGLIQASDEELRALLVNTWVLAASWSGFTHGLNPDIADDEHLDRRLLRQGIYQIICLEAPYLRGEALQHLEAAKRAYRMDETTLDRLFGIDPDSVARRA